MLSVSCLLALAQQDEDSILGFAFGDLPFGYAGDGTECREVSP